MSSDVSTASFPRTDVCCRMSIAQGSVFGISWSLNSPINMGPKIRALEDLWWDWLSSPTEAWMIPTTQSREPFEKFVDWRQCVNVMWSEAVTVMPSWSGGGNVVVAWSSCVSRLNSETVQFIHQAYGDDVMRRTAVFMWLKHLETEKRMWKVKTACSTILL
jgi:hypothetical protein